MVVNENFFTRNMTKLKFAFEQFLPNFRDADNQVEDINNLNKIPNQSQQNSKEKLVINETD